MVRDRLVSWQWNDYARFHASGVNRALHLVGVPLFVAGVLGGVGALALGRPHLAVLGPVAMVVGFGLQAVGHKRFEAVPAIPFDGPADALTRIFTEQFVTFWRFVASGFRGA